MIIDVAVPPVIIRAIPLVIRPVVAPGVEDVRTCLLGIGLGVGLGLVPTDIVLLGVLVIMALGIGRLSVLFLPHLLL